jgi:ankyrin repeat protein
LAFRSGTPNEKKLTGKLYAMLNDKTEKSRLDEICDAAFDGNINLLRNLLVNEIDLNKCGRNWTPLRSAIENENIECVKLLIEKGANVEYCGEGCSPSTPLAHAVDISVQSNNNTGGKEGDESTEIINILLAAGADPRSGLHIAELYGTQKILAFLKAHITKDNKL